MFRTVYIVNYPSFYLHKNLIQLNIIGFITGIMDFLIKGKGMSPKPSLSKVAFKDCACGKSIVVLFAFLYFK